MDRLETDIPATGCLVLVLQMSASMQTEVPSYRGPFPKSHLVRLLADEVVEDLVVDYSEGLVPERFEVSVVGYRVVNEGPAAISILPDDKPHPHFLTVRQLSSIDVPRRKRGDMLRKWTGSCDEAGDASPVAALANAHWIVQRWQAEHPRALPPIVVHCCDGTGLNPEYDFIAQCFSVLQSGEKSPVLFHCVISEHFSGRMIPVQYCGGLSPSLEQLWNASSALESEPINCRGHRPRGLSINDWPRAEIKQIWERLLSPPPPEPIEPLPLPEEVLIASTEVLEFPADAPVAVEAVQPIEQTVSRDPKPLFSHRSFWYVKRGNDPNQWEDAFCVDPMTGAIAIADGAGAGIFCRQWAALLAERWTRELPDVADPKIYQTWMDGCRNAWMEAIGYKTIRIFQKMKVDDVGAAATLLGLRIERDPKSDDYRWSAVAVGDSVLFWIRDQNLLAAFPLTRGSQFDIAPLLLRSKRMPLPGFARASSICKAGDLFVLATDAVAHALFDEHDRGPVDWARFETLEQSIWEQEMDRLRDENRMVNDDCTLVVLRIGQPAPTLPEAPAEPASMTETETMLEQPLPETLTE